MSAEETRRRAGIRRRLAPILEYDDNGTLLSTKFSGAGSNPIWVETLVSAGHRYADLGTGGNIGGPFSHRTTKITELPFTWNEAVPTGINKGDYIRGPGYACTRAQINDSLDEMIPLAPYGSNSAMDAHGTTAISRGAPTSPSVSLYQTLGELRAEGLPRFGLNTMKERTRRAKNAGDDYLNVQFGWMPLVSDMRGYAKLMKTSDEVIRQYKRDADRPVRRRMEMLNTVTRSTGTGGSGVWTDPLPSSKFLGSGGVRRWHQEVQTRVWFSGAFIYHLPLTDSAMDKLALQVKLADRLLGISPTPDRLWELTPWSWFVDWFSNTGDILTNLRAFLFDNLVMPYGYVMQETKVTRTWTLEGAKTITGRPITCSTTIEHLAQKRRQANPFGFGLTWDGLSPYQISILGALGLTRGA
jgi:hypothetical protein